MTMFEKVTRGFFSRLVL